MPLLPKNFEMAKDQERKLVELSGVEPRAFDFLCQCSATELQLPPATTPKSGHVACSSLWLIVNCHVNWYAILHLIKHGWFLKCRISPFLIGWGTCCLVAKFSDACLTISLHLSSYSSWFNLHIQYTSQVTYANLTNSEEFCCRLLWMAAQPVEYCLCPVCRMYVALSIEFLCCICGMSVLCPRNIGVLYAAYPGSDSNSSLYTCAKRKTPHDSRR